MPAPVALIKLAQGLSTPPAGQALAGVAAVEVDITNATLGLDVGSWEIELVDAPPGGAVLPALLAFSDVPSVPEAISSELIPDATPGCYRIMMRLWEVAGRVGAPDSIDIRNFAVPEPISGHIFPPYQELPPKLPVLGSGLLGEKPDELNFDGQPFGWAGDGTDGLLLEQLRAYTAALAGGGGSASTYETAFNSGNLSGGILTVVHNLNSDIVAVTVKDENEEKVEPDNITFVDVNTVDIDLNSLGVPASPDWKVGVIG